MGFLLSGFSWQRNRLNAKKTQKEYRTFELLESGIHGESMETYASSFLTAETDRFERKFTSAMYVDYYRAAYWLCDAFAWYGSSGFILYQELKTQLLD